MFHDTNIPDMDIPDMNILRLDIPDMNIPDTAAPPREPRPAWPRCLDCGQRFLDHDPEKRCAGCAARRRRAVQAYRASRRASSAPQPVTPGLWRGLESVLWTVLTLASIWLTLWLLFGPGGN